MYKIPLRELKTRKLRIRIAKPHQRVRHLLSTHVVDTRQPDGKHVFYASIDEAKRAELEAWRNLQRRFSKRRRDISSG